MLLFERLYHLKSKRDRLKCSWGRGFFEKTPSPTGKRRFCIHNMYNKDSNYISIGEMAKINRTTVPTLKLYDSMGLLTPYYVDEHSHIATI